MIRRSAMRWPLVLALSASALGCGFFQQLEVQPVATSFRKPSNVAAYVAVMDDGKPVTELSANNFRVYENEQLVPSEQTQLTLLERQVAVAHHTLLLIDMSGEPTVAARAQAEKAALGFIEKVSPQQGVSVFAFSGGERLEPIAEVAAGARQTALPALAGFSTTDASRNLNGAVVAALAQLDNRLLRSGKSLKVGTLVVFSGGPDIAGRVDESKLRDALTESPHELIAVGIAEQAAALEGLGRRDVVVAQSKETLAIAFEEAADSALGELAKYYLISYCSPARAGTRRLRLSVSYTTKQGEEHSGDFETDIDAAGFGPGCDPSTPPRFVAQPKSEPADESARQEKTKRTPGPGPAGAQQSTGKEPEDDAPVAPPDQSGYAK